MTTIGSTLGNFRIEALLGKGGMGEVYLGYDPRLERRVAIKTIRPEERLSGVQKARFLREARLLSKLGHPSICQVYDLIEGPEADYLVLEYIEGVTLGDLVKKQSLSLDRKLDLAEKIARALEVAHREQVVHRDLKADNVMVTPRGEVKVLDFGIARSVSDPGVRLLGPPPLPGLDRELERAADSGGEAGREESTRADGAWAKERQGLLFFDTIGLTQHGVIIGSLQAMSPEQAAGGEVTTASDLYSLGVLLQFLLTGESAYTAQDELERLAQIRRGETRPLPAGPSFDPDLVVLLRDLQSLDPGRRPTAGTAAEHLRLIRTKPQRLRLRRLRRLAIAATFVLLAFGLALLSWFAFEATKARREAERRRRQAEGLIGFMLGDLRGRLERVNRLDVLDVVGDRALAYFGELPEGELTRQELIGRVEAVLQIGEVRYAQGNLAAALIAFRRADRLASEIVARDPLHREGAFQRVTAQGWIGQTLFDQLRLDEALSAWRSSEAIARQQLSHRPSDLRWLDSLATAQHNVGTVLEQRGELAAALAEYRLSLERKRALAARAPDNVEIQSGIAATLAFVSNTLERQGDLAGAEAERRVHLAILEGLAVRDPGDPVRRYDRAVAEGFLAGLLAVRGERAEARRLYETGLETFTRLASDDADNALHQRWLGAFQSAFGALLAEGGELRAARPWLERAGALFKALRLKDPSNPDYRQQLGVSQLRLAQALEGVDPRHALALARDAIATLAPFAGAEANESILGWCATARVTAGRLEAIAGNHAAARAAWEDALRILSRCRRPLTHWKVLVPWTEAQLSLGSLTEARPAIERLRRMGYVHREHETVAGERGLP